jgi:hypothetical protein
MLNTASFFDELDQIISSQDLRKEAGWGRDFKAWVLKRHRSAKQLSAKVNNASIKLYTKLPEPVQKAVVHPSLTDTSDSMPSTALGNAARHLLKLGSYREKPPR